MKIIPPLLEWWRRRAQSLLFFAWTAAMAVLLVGGGWAQYVGPTFQLFMGIGLLLFLAFGIVAWTASQNTTPPPVPLGSFLLLVLPLFVLAATGSESLGGDAYSTRKQGGSRSSFRATRPSLFPTPVGGGPIETSTLELNEFGDSFEGLTVKFSGRVAKDERWGPEFFVLYRFQIVCCAADAIPVAVLVENTPKIAAQKDDWLEVTGRFGIEQKNEQSIPTVRKTILRKIPAPERPYLNTY